MMMNPRPNAPATAPLFAHFWWVPILLIGGAGCSIFNKPDRDLIVEADAAPIRDSAADARFDGDFPSDGGTDGGRPERETDCSNGADDDGDGLTDCGDFDCSELPICCGTSNRTVDGWEAPLNSRWRAVPSADALYPSVRESRITDFGTTTFPRAMVSRLCLPLALGVELRTSLRAVRRSDCSDAPCFASLVLTAADDVLAGNRLPADLAITRFSTGLLEVSQADAPIVPGVGFPAGDDIEVVVQITPSLDEIGRPTLAAQVSAFNQSEGGVVYGILERQQFILQRDLIDSVADCDGAPGLYLAIEGQGSAVEVGPITTILRECVNPSHFTRPAGESATLTSTHLGLGEWSGGGIAAPALASSLVSSGGPVRWDLMVDASDRERPLEKYTHIGFAIGHSFTSAWDAPWQAPPSGASKAGDDPPTCPEGTSCPNNRSLREPALLATTDSEGRLASLVGAVARELDDEARVGNRDIYGVHVIASVPTAPESRFTPSMTPTVRPSDTGPAESPDACVSLRDPEIIPAGRLVTDGFWLLFTCERRTTASAIGAVRITQGGELVADTYGIVLEPRDLGTYARGGIRAPEGLARYSDTGAGAFRLWFLALDQRSAGTGVAMVFGQTSDGHLPRRGELVPYPANPVLGAEATVLGGCAMGCELLGLSVTPRPDRDHTLRFLVARRVNVVDDVQYQLVPLEQFWRAPW